MVRSFASSLAFCLVFSAACREGPGLHPEETGADGSSQLDAADVAVTHASHDAAGLPDASNPGQDAGPPADAAPMADAAPSTDATSAFDATPGGDVMATDGGALDGRAAADATPRVDVPDAGLAGNDSGPRAAYPAEHCAYFLTGEVDLDGVDADGDGVPNGWDYCPNNPSESLDSDRDGIGNQHDPDVDGDGVLNQDDTDRDGDGATDAAEQTAGTDPADPSSLPGARRFDPDVGIFNPRPGWYRGDLHVHTTYSHDGHATLASYIPVAKGAGLDFMWITDHRVFDAPFDAAWNQRDVLLIPAQEWGGGCHANMGGMRTANEANYDDPNDIRRSWHLGKLQGTVQSLNHYGKDVDDWTRIFAAAPDLMDEIDVLEAWNSLWQFNSDTNVSSLAYYDGLLSQGRRIGAVGGSDCHYTHLTLGMPTTVVWAKSLSVLGILDGIRRGRTYITQNDPFRDGLALTWEGRPELEFRVDADGDGTFEAMLGDVVRPGQITMKVAVRHAYGPVVIIRNGTEITRFDDHADGADIDKTFVDTAPSGAWYRVQMKRSALASSPFLLLSSPIYVSR